MGGIAAAQAWAAGSATSRTPSSLRPLPRRLRRRRGYTGHGIGSAMHMSPSVPNSAVRAGALSWSGPGAGRRADGHAGQLETSILDDDWTASPTTARWAAHFEHTFTLTPTALGPHRRSTAGGQARPELGVCRAPKMGADLKEDAFSPLLGAGRRRVTPDSVGNYSVDLCVGPTWGSFCGCSDGCPRHPLASVVMRARACPGKGPERRHEVHPARRSAHRAVPGPR